MVPEPVRLTMNYSTRFNIDNNMTIDDRVTKVQKQLPVDRPAHLWKSFLLLIQAFVFALDSAVH